MSRPTAAAVLAGSLLLCVALANCQPIFGQPPQFTQEPEDTFVFETDASGQPTTLTISCGTSGDPTPTVTGFRSGEEVDSSLVLESGTLSMPNITEGESASRDGIPYYCTATNTLGTIRSKTVQVFYAFFDGIAAPNISESVNVTAGLDVALLCDIPSASPPPVIEWWDDNGVLLASNAIHYLNRGRYLLLRELTVEKISRTYHCRVTNALLHTTVPSTGSYTLNNLGADFPEDTLVIYKELEMNVTALVGETVLFSFVSATLNSIFVTRYQMDGLTLGITTLGPLGEIRNVSLPRDGLKYEVTLTVVFNNHTIVRSSTLTVYEPAFISDVSPNMLDQFVGDPLSFVCTVAGTPAPDVVWYFNGEILTPTGGLTINGGTIDIPSPTTDHSGMYQCFVSNPANTVHASIALQVREPDPPMITGISPPGNDRCRDIPTYVRPAGDTLTLSVDVTADPCPEVEWRVDGRTLTEVEESAGCNMTFYTTNSCSDFPDPATGSYTFTIAISNVTDCTAGRYTITLINRAGDVTSDPVFVTPEVPVRVVGVQIQNAICLRDSMNATISCEVEGYPYPGIAFLKDNMPLMPESGWVTVTDCMMVVLTPVMISDEGLYSCTAENVANGETITVISDAAELVYCTLPEVTILDPPRTFDEGEDIEFTCSVSGTPPPEFTWLKDGVVLSEDDDERVTIFADLPSQESQLEITSVIPADSGAYTCIATNPAGEARRVTSVDIIASSNPVLSTEAIIGIAVGTVGGLLLILVVIVLLCCVYTFQSGECVVSGGAKPVNNNNNQDFTDGRGNVDQDSDEEDVGEPVVRPAAPPQYKPTPHYPHGAPLTADDIEMTKVPPPDTDSTHFSEFMGAPCGRQDNGSMPPGGVAPGYRPSVDDFLSEDAQFV